MTRKEWKTGQKIRERKREREIEMETKKEIEVVWEGIETRNTHGTLTFFPSPSSPFIPNYNPQTHEV